MRLLSQAECLSVYGGLSDQSQSVHQESLREGSSIAVQVVKGYGAVLCV